MDNVSINTSVSYCYVKNYSSLAYFGVITLGHIYVFKGKNFKILCFQIIYHKH